VVVGLQRIVALALVAATVALTGCGSRGAAPREPGTITSVTRTDGATMNPLFAQTVEDALVYPQLIFESLSYTGTDYLAHPRLATSWSHSPDGRHWTVELRHDVRWSDGQPMTSKDVVFTYNALIDPKTIAISSGDLVYLQRITADGPYRVKFDLKYPSATFTINGMGVEASIVPEHILGKVPHDRLRFTDFGEHPIGTGPFKLERWLHDSETDFVRNPYAWRPPHIDRFIVRTIFNDQSALEALENGSVDLYDDLGSSQYKQLDAYPQIYRQTFASLYTDVTLPNTRRPGLSDVNVRRAMMYGQDRAALVKGFFDNRVPIPDGLIPIGLTHWYNPHVVKYAYDPAKARAILDAAGWKVGADGVRRRGNQRLAFELLLNQGSALLTNIMIAFCSDMQAIGIDVSLRQLDFPSMVAREYKGNFDLIAEGFGGATDPDMTAVLSSTQYPPAGNNTTFFTDKTMDELLKRGLTELDDNKRRAIYDQVQVETAKQVPILWQYGRFAGYARSAHLQLDPKTTLQSPLLFFNIEDWKDVP
jgi:peptide/nickel transport system substrate-binding protein